MTSMEGEEGILKAVIYYFSGTGNTEIVVKLLAEALKRESNYQVSLVRMEEMLNRGEVVTIEKNTLVGFAFPVYGFGSPQLVDAFIEKQVALKATANKCFILMTAADFVGVNHNGAASVKANLESSKLDVFYERIIAMGSNYVVGYDRRFIKQLYEAAKEKAVHMAGEIAEHKVRLYSPSRMTRKLTQTVNHIEARKGSKKFGELLKATDSCTHCGLCEQNCPAENIQLIDGTPKFSSKCIMCMRCIYACPESAIYPGTMKFMVLKEGYDIHSILVDSQIDSDYVTERTKGYYKHFYRYLNDASL